MKGNSITVQSGGNDSGGPVVPKSIANLAAKLF